MEIVDLAFCPRECLSNPLGVSSVLRAKETRKREIYGRTHRFQWTGAHDLT